MKKILLLGTFFINTLAFAQMQVIVSPSGSLQYPAKENFKNSNDIASDSEVVKKSDIFYQLFFDTSPTIDIESPTKSTRKTVTIPKPYYLNASGNRVATVSSSGGNLSTSTYVYDNCLNVRYWTDVEFKIIRKSDGALVYWVSTQGGATDPNYFNHSARDENAKIFYTVASSENDGRNWIQRSDSEGYSNYEHAISKTSETAIIGGIVIEPNLSGKTKDGTDIVQFFINSEDYFFVFIKIDPNGIEKTPNGSAIWRPYNALSQGVITK